MVDIRSASDRGAEFKKLLICDDMYCIRTCRSTMVMICNMARCSDRSLVLPQLLQGLCIYDTIDLGYMYLICGSVSNIVGHWYNVDVLMRMSNM